jgi:hypothetical protein
MTPKMHIVIPDVQARPGVPLQHLDWISNYIETKKPDRVICIGAFADMPSLSGYEVGKASAEGRRYRDDLDCSYEGMARLTRFAKSHDCPMDITLGNHEDRIEREANAQPKFRNTLSISDLRYEDHGWNVHPFLKVIKRDGIEYSHYFVSGSMGRPVSSAAALLRQRQCSAVMGHVQRLDLAVHPNTQYVGLFTGICYLHDEPYLTPQGNNTRRGIWRLNEVRNGTFDPLFISLDFLQRRYS